MDKAEHEETVHTPMRQDTEESASGENSTKSENREEKQTQETRSAAENKARLVIGGLVAVAILSVIAALVTGIFQLCSNWTACKPNLPVSDAAPLLWNRVVSDRITPASTGVPEKLAEEVRFKGPDLAGQPTREQ